VIVRVEATDKLWDKIGLCNSAKDRRTLWGRQQRYLFRNQGPAYSIISTKQAVETVNSQQSTVNSHGEFRPGADVETYFHHNVVILPKPSY